MILAIVFAVVLGLLVVFQLALAFGAPWGAFAWGGQHSGVLPVGYRIASGLSVLVYATIALLALDLAGVIDVVPNAVSQVGMWVVFGLLALGVVMNAISRSKRERNAMTPVALVLAVLALLIALAGPAAQTLTGLVVDDGTAQGPRLCTGPVITIYPPQCSGPDSILLDGWEWDAVEHQQEQSVRFGNYTITGTLDGDVLRVSTATVDGAAP